MSQSQTQLQELEQTILQRRQYLQGQDNQIQRNLTLLKSQKSELDYNEARLLEQTESLKELEHNQDTVLAELRVKAEQTPSKRFRELTKACDDLQQLVADLDKQKRGIERALNDSEDHLEQLDMDIIEADAIHKELLDRIKDSKNRLKEAQRGADFQTAVVQDLQNEAIDSQEKLDMANRNKLGLEKEQGRLIKDLKSKNQELESVINELVEKNTELSEVKNGLKEATERLKSTIDKDRNFRKGLAEEKLRIERDQENIKSTKQAINKEVMANEQIYPKWNLKVKPEPKHFKL